jgi:tetratricopeptide (TPR) repeat protein
MYSPQYIHNAWWLLAMLPMLAGYLWFARWRAQALVAAGDPGLILARLKGFSALRGWLRLCLRLAAVLLLVLGLVNWQRPVEQAGGQLGGLDVVLALDVSNSMMATDLPPNRLEKARLFASRLMDTLQGNRVGIVAFAGDAFVQLPLTTDVAAGRMYLQSVTTGLVPSQGTNLYKALQTCRQAFDAAEKKYKAVVLVTDGEEHEAAAERAADSLSAEGVVLLTIGAGSPAGATLPSGNGQPRTNNRGEVVVSKLNTALLRQLAKATKGAYFALSDIDETVAALMAEINSMDKKTIQNSRLINYQSFSHVLIALALVLLVAELLLPAGRKKKRQQATKRAIISALAGCLLAPAGLWAQNQNTDALLRKANKAYLDQSFVEAKTLYEQVLKANPAQPMAQHQLGNMAYRNKQFAEAAGHFKSAANAPGAAPQQAMAYNNGGLSYAQNAEPNLPKAIESFKAALRTNPYDAEVRNNLYRALEEWKKQQQAQQPPPDTSGPKKQPPTPKFDQKQANQKLQAMQQEEKRIRDKMNKPQSGGTGDKDW